MKFTTREFFMMGAFLLSLAFLLFAFNDFYKSSVVPEVAAKAKNIARETMPVVKPMAVEDRYIYYDVELSRELQEYTQDVCKGYNVPFELSLAVMYVESRYQPQADNGQCVGLFQINVDYAETYYTELDIKDIKDPRDNILSGVWYLSKLMGKHDDLNLALMHYNIGNKADEYWAQGVRETEYTKKVIAAEISLKKQVDIVQE